MKMTSRLSQKNEAWIFSTDFSFHILLLYLWIIQMHAGFFHNYNSVQTIKIAFKLGIDERDALFWFRNRIYFPDIFSIRRELCNGRIRMKYSISLLYFLVQFNGLIILNAEVSSFERNNSIFDSGIWKAVIMKSIKLK